MIRTTPAFFRIILLGPPYSNSHEFSPCFFNGPESSFRDHTGFRPENTRIGDSAETSSDPLFESAKNFPDDEDENEKTIFPQPRRPRIPPARPCREAGENGFLTG